MIAIDSSALVAILRRGPEADAFLQIIVDAEGCVLSSVNLLETSLVLAGRFGGPSNWLELDIFVEKLDIEIVAQDAAMARGARDAFLRYGKGRHPAALNLGDCAAYALAKARSVPLLFTGDDFSRTDLIPAG